MNAGLALEIACDGVGSALAAQSGGADRVELFADLAAGGVTPSHGTIAVARDRLRLPLFVLVRPRAGDFLYGDWEIEAMLEDIRHCRTLGVDGVVLGALTAEGDIDTPRCAELISAAGGMQVTFHRAFDAVRDPVQALQAVIDLGCTRVLTSGGQASAAAGAAALALAVRQSAGRVRVMAGAGITADNIAGIAMDTGCSDLHASAKALRSSAMQHRNPALRGLEVDYWQSDALQVAALRAALDTVVPL